jgi:flavin reductase
MDLRVPTASINEVRLDEYFREAMRGFAPTVCIISCSDDEGHSHGMSATAVTSMCVDPPTLLVCINNSTATYSALSRSGRLCVNILRSFHSQLSQDFSGKVNGNDLFRFGNCNTASDGVLSLAPFQTAALFCEERCDLGPSFNKSARKRSLTGRKL